MKALVIDDTLTSSTLLAQRLRKMGIEPVCASDGLGGIELFKAHRPDLVLLDVAMPGLDGYETAKRMRQLERDGEWTPILFLTARTGDDDLARGIAVGGDDFLVTPVSEIILQTKVRAMQRMTQMRHSLVVLTRRLDEANRELTRLSAEDSLTGVANRRQFDQILRREWSRGARSASPISLLMCDVDHFKQYNDLYGHPAGDACLREIGRLLKDCARRPADLAARYGGEEFALILPDTDSEGAGRVARLLGQQLEALALRHEGSDHGRVTLSIGVASSLPRRDAGSTEDLVAAADRALYRAKHAGRNQVQFTVGEPS